MVKAISISAALVMLAINAAPAELHIYAGSGHGFGFRPPSTTNSQPSTGTSKWIERFEEWLEDSGFSITR